MILQQILEGRPLTGKAYMLDAAEKVAHSHNMSLGTLMQRRRTPRICLARHEAWATIYDTGRFSLSQIGMAFDRDHSTILHGIKQHRALAERGIAA